MRFLRISFPLLALLGWLSVSTMHAAEARPNVLFIVADDLNHWVGSLQRNPQTKTPNLDRLAQRGVNFTNAYCASSICNPSRAALLSGKRTATIGVYSNGHLPWTDYIDESQCLNAHFRANGYYTAGAGKIFHVGGGFKNSQGTQWDDYVVGFGKDQDVEDDEPKAGKGKQKRFTNGPGALKQEPRKGNIKIGEFEIGAPAIPDRETEDYRIAEWGARQLAQKREQPFFLALGFHKPHLPWIVPKKYFDLFPLETIELPPHRTDDLADLPPAAKKWAHTARWTSVMDAGGEKAWKQVVQAYLASVAYLDAQVGVVLDALEKSPNRDNTIVIFFGDHGWHFGEKERFGKTALWEEGTRAPLTWIAPGVTKPGQRCETPVEFLSIYPTLCDLAGLPKPAFLEGVSIRPLLANPRAEWTRPALTTFGFNNHAVRSTQYRYIRYANGDEELYDEKADPYEWTNLAAKPELAGVKTDLARWMPKDNKPDQRVTRRP
jgi:arylsulfatase A-like enzyme